MRVGAAIAGMLLAAPLSLMAAVIDVREQVAVAPGTLLTLGDVAVVTESDAARSAALRALPLGPAPAAGRTWRLTYEDLRQRLQARGENLAAIEFRGRQAVTVTSAETSARESKPAAVVAPPARVAPPPSESARRRANLLVASALERSFKAASSTSAVQFRCEVADADVASVLACRPDAIHFVPAAMIADQNNNLTAWWLTPAGQRVDVPVRATFSERRQVLSVKYSIPKGYTLQPEDLAWMPAEDDATGVARLADVVGKETTRTLRAGQVIAPPDVADVPLVRTNDIVTVVVRRPGIAVRRQCKALSSGSLDDTVTLVALDDSRLRLQAIVTGYHEATISAAGEALDGATPISNTTRSTRNFVPAPGDRP